MEQPCKLFLVQQTVTIGVKNVEHVRSLASISVSSWVVE